VRRFLAFVAATTTFAALSIVATVAVQTAAVHPAYALADGQALTPPMGFNNWNATGCAIDEKLIKDTADRSTKGEKDIAVLGYKSRLRAAEKAMEDLRADGSATISLPFLTADAHGPRHFNIRCKRNADSTFELVP